MAGQGLWTEYQAAGGKPSGGSASWLAEGQPQDLQRSLDADTVEATKPGSKLVNTVRFAGIDAPEMEQGLLGKSAQDWLDQETKKAKKISVRKLDTDHHGRAVSTLMADGRNLNVELVRQGHAKVYSRYLNKFPKEFQKELLAAQEEASSAERGLWAPDSGYEDSEEFRRRQQAMFGSGAGARGHDARSRVDPEAVTARDINRAVAAEKGERPNLWNDYLGVSGAPGAVPRAAGAPSKADGPGNYEHDPGFLGSVLEGLDYAGNAARSFLKGGNVAQERGGGLGEQFSTGVDYARQALKKRRQTTASDLKDSFTRKWGLGKVRAGREDGQFQLGDVADFSADLLLDVVTDPITYVTTGAGALVKGATRGTKYLAAVAPAGRAALGATYGAGSTAPDATPLERIGAAAVGAGLGLAAGPAMDAFGKRARKGFDAVTNWYAVKTRGAAFADFATQKALAIEAFDKKRNVAEWIRQGRLDALKELEPAERLEATRVMQELKTETIKRRKAYEEQLGLKDGTPAWNQMMQRVNREVETEVLPAVLADQGEAIGRAVKGWGEHNDRVMEKLNRDIFGILPEVRHEVNAGGRGVVGLKFHIDDVYRKTDFQEAQKALADAQIHKARSLSRSTASKIAGPDFSYGAYAEDFSKNFLDKKAREAMDIVRQYGETPAKQAAVRGLEKGLHGFDRLTNFIKANMLYFSTSWLKNNYFDNVAKAWVENGLQGVADAATTGAFRHSISKDVWDLYKGNISRAYESKHFMDALNLGVLDNPMFKSMTDDLTRDFIMRPKEIAQANEKTLANYLGKAQEVWFTKNPVIAMVGRMGSYMEGTARMMTYVRAYEALKASKSMAGVADRTLKEMAASIVKKSFFDYGDVSALESAVFKRLVPFYSFYAKNLPYWAKATFDPQKAARVIALEKVRHNIGRTPTERDREGMTPYIEGSAPRKLGKDEKGNQEYLIFPSTSMHDAVKMVNPKEWVGQFVEKSTPVPKAIIELVSGKDAFSGDNLYPKDQEGGKKFLYSRGFKWVAVRRIVEAMGKDPDSVFQKVAKATGVEVDDNGNPYTTEGWTVVLDKIGSTVLPHGVIDQLAGSAGKIGYGKEDLDEAVFNLVSAAKGVKVSPSFARMVRQRKQKEKANGN